MKNDSLFLGILYNRRSHFAPPSMGRKWVVGADSSHTEISVIVWLRVTSTPQWQQLLINPTSHHPALPIGGFSPKLSPLNFFSVYLTACVWMVRWWGGGFSDCSLSTRYSVVCITCIVTGWHCCHFSTLLKAGDSPLTVFTCLNPLMSAPPTPSPRVW